MYILECADGSYYTGSTKDLERRLCEHQNALGANYTKRRLPVKLVYYEEYLRIDEAFYREKQVQGWSHNKKKALIEGCSKDLPLLSRNYTQFGKPVASTGSATLPGIEHVGTPIVPNSATTREKCTESRHGRDKLCRNPHCSKLSNHQREGR
jgi:putative endonuclease